MTPNPEPSAAQKEAVMLAVLKKAIANGFDLKGCLHRKEIHIQDEPELAAKHMARSPLLIAVLCSDNAFCLAFWPGHCSSTPPPPRGMKDRGSWMATADLRLQSEAMRNAIFYSEDPYEFLDRFLEDTDLPPYPFSE